MCKELFEQFALRRCISNFSLIMVVQRPNLAYSIMPGIYKNCYYNAAPSKNDIFSNLEIQLFHTINVVKKTEHVDIF